MLSKNKGVQALQVIGVLVAAAAAEFFVPEHILRPAAIAVFAVAVGGSLALKACIGKLRAAGAGDAEAAVRRIMLQEADMALAIVGFVAFVILLIEFGD